MNSTAGIRCIHTGRSYVLRDLLVVNTKFTHKPALVTTKRVMSDHARKSNYVDTITDFKVGLSATKDTEYVKEGWSSREGGGGRRPSDFLICFSEGGDDSSRFCQERPILRLLCGLPLPTDWTSTPEIPDRPVCLAGLGCVPGGSDCSGQSEWLAFDLIQTR